MLWGYTLASMCGNTCMCVGNYIFERFNALLLGGSINPVGYHIDSYFIDSTLKLYNENQEMMKFTFYVLSSPLSVFWYWCVCIKLTSMDRFPPMYRDFLNTLQWRHNGLDVVSNHQPQDCLLNRLFRRRSKKAQKLRVTGLCAGNSPVTDEFPSQRASSSELFPFDDVIM